MNDLEAILGIIKGVLTANQLFFVVLLWVLRFWIIRPISNYFGGISKMMNLGFNQYLRSQRKRVNSEKELAATILGLSKVIESQKKSKFPFIR